MADQASSTTKVKYLILGAGVSGLTFANFVNDYLIIEKEARVGGYCKTVKKGPYIFDYAGHFFHFKTEEWKNFFLNNIDQDELVKKQKCTKIVFKDRLIDYPFQLNIHQLDKEDFIDCLYDLFDKEEIPEYANFLEMLYGKFGRSITELFLKPYNEKLYAVNLDKLDTNAMGRFFPYADKEQIIKNMKEKKNTSYNDTFLYPKEGAEAFIKVLEKKLDKNKILLNTTVKSINLEEKYIIINDEQKIYFDYLINTMPLNQFLNLSHESPELSRLLSYNKVLVFNLGFSKKSSFKDEHWLYIPEKKYNFYRLGFYDNILNQPKLSMYVEIGLGKDESPNIEQELSNTLENLKTLKIIDDENTLEAVETIIMDPAYVHIEERTNKEIEKLMTKLNSQNIFSIGRYGAWTYCSIEDCMVKAKSLANQLENQ